MELEAVKATLTELVEAAGESGITEVQAAREIITRHRMGYYEAIESLKSVYQDAGVERTPEHIGKVISYYKAKQEKQPEESMAVRIAKKLGKRNIGERGRMEILNHYIR